MRRFKSAETILRMVNNNQETEPRLECGQHDCLLQTGIAPDFIKLELFRGFGPGEGYPKPPVLMKYDGMGNYNSVHYRQGWGDWQINLRTIGFRNDNLNGFKTYVYNPRMFIKRTKQGIEFGKDTPTCIINSKGNKVCKPNIRIHKDNVHIGQ